MKKKSDVRKEVLTRLSELSAQVTLKEEKEFNVLAQLSAMPEWQNAKVIGTILPMTKEFDTYKIIKQAEKENKKIVVPKTKPERGMDFVTYKIGDALEKTSFGVKEPVVTDIALKSEIDLLIVPGVGFRSDGYRVGFGGGYYDRFLSDFPNKTCSVVFQEQLAEDWEPGEYDLPVSQLIIDQLSQEA